jgi:hypothetical protein
MTTFAIDLAETANRRSVKSACILYYYFSTHAHCRPPVSRVELPKKLQIVGQFVPLVPLAGQKEPPVD